MPKRRDGPDRRVGEPLTIPQVLALAVGPRTDPGPLALPRWDANTFEDDDAALAAWHYWSGELRETCPELFGDGPPRWMRELVGCDYD